MKRSETVYQWQVMLEDVGPHGTDRMVFPNRTKLMAFCRTTKGEAVLVRYHADFPGFDTEYAMLDDQGRLPVCFDGGTRVPKRFHSRKGVWT